MIPKNVLHCKRIILSYNYYTSIQTIFSEYYRNTGNRLSVLPIFSVKLPIAHYSTLHIIDHVINCLFQCQFIF
jgi:hypothetical protein